MPKTEALDRHPSVEEIDHLAHKRILHIKQEIAIRLHCESCEYCKALFELALKDLDEIWQRQELAEENLKGLRMALVIFLLALISVILLH